MAVLDPFDMLVRLGKITQAQRQAADLVASAVGTSTQAARLVAVGVDKQKLLEALSDLTRMPVAPAQALADAAPMKLPASYSRLMKELLAVPIGRVDDHILDVAIADPRTTTKLRDAAIAHRPQLALESDVIAALKRVFPGTEVLDPLTEPTLKNVPISPRPVSVNDEAPSLLPEPEPSPAMALPVDEPAPAVDIPLSSVERLDDEAPPPDVSAIDDAAAEQTLDGEPPMSPFRIGKSADEVTQRVREPRRPDVHDEDQPASRAQRLEQQARALAQSMRENVARTLGIVAVTAVVVALVVLAFVVGTQPDAAVASDPSRQDASRQDAGVALTIDAGVPAPPAVLEKPANDPPPKRKRKPPRKSRPPPKKNTR